MPKKQLQRYRSGKPVHYHHSIKNGRRYWCESLLERDYLLTLEFDPKVDAFLPQPLSIRWWDGTRWRTYTPDNLLWWKDGHREFVEVRPEAKLNPEQRWKLDQLHHRCRQRFGVPLRLATDREIRAGETVNNLQRLYPYRRFDLSPYTEAIADIRSRLPSTTLQALKDEIEAQGLQGAMAFALLAHRVYAWESAEQLSPETHVEAA